MNTPTEANQRASQTSPSNEQGLADTLAMASHAAGTDRIDTAFGEIALLKARLQQLEQKQGAMPVQSAPGSVMPEIMLMQEVADYLRLSLRKVAELIETGELVPMRIGRSVRFHRDTVQAFLRHSAVRGRAKGADRKTGREVTR